MSGLEPIAALGLACNILQVIGTGLETVRVAKQVYQNDKLDPALTESARILDDLSSRIRSTTTVASTAKPKAQEKQLFDLAEKCQRASRALCEEVNFLNGQPTKAKLSGSIKTALKTMWRKRRLETLDQQLKEAESLLQTGLLTTIFEQSNSDLSSLDADLKAFIVEYRKGHAGATDLMRKHIPAEIETNRKAIELHVTQTVSEAESSLKSHIGVAIGGVTRHEQDAQIQNKRDRLLRSLKFDRMNERRNQVTSSHHNTFTWMLRDGSEVEGSQRSTEMFDHESGSSWQDGRDNWELSYARTSWDSFSDWLRSTDSVYWISGKPGSGKTTLMKYILGQPQTQTYLDQWKPDAIIISHFFWRPGTVMQQSIKGLMSSLLHQLLLGEPGVVDQVLGSTADMPRKESETDWSPEELRETLHYVISRYPRPIAIFLDGLDEVLPRDGVLRLLNIIDQLRQPCGDTGKIKLCLGSRPETLLYKHLCGYPQLRLEQLNRVDLWQYGNDHVIIPSDYRIVIPYNHGMYYPAVNYPREKPPSRDEFREWLVWTLVTKAEGVFLWLCLTVTTIAKALNQDETFEDLEARIQSLPSDLADLYADMWNRMNDDGSHLRVRAASYLQLALANTGYGPEWPLNLFTMMVSTTPEKAGILLRPDPSQRTSKLFELISLFITNGADPHEEIHVAIEAKAGRIEFKDLWPEGYRWETEESPEGSPTESGHILIILAYPASALLANILQIWKVADHSQVGWVPKICELPGSGVGKGRPISVVEMGDVYKRRVMGRTPPLFLSTGIFNMRHEAGMEKHFLGLIRLVEESLQGVVAEGKKHFNEYSGGCLSHVSVPLEVQAEMEAGLQRLRSTNVPVKERRKELRTRLGVITPLEEPEWQNLTFTVNSSQLVSRTPPSEDGSSKEGKEDE
ncbi:hypothetical protein INS49_014315 [Diaporthe citri]|uniref:uncharacterized protein n=1 Tax=Diaporthe citri TaxID=83186 RepID=UPI001C7E6839|nr:uncharacterized protein INS49_014315 [Diaporthe citri]KAG6358431.1 hypothetical protein INS49_014315 [Diaporthe citri]